MALGRIRSLDLLEAVSLSRLQEVEARLKYSNFLATARQIYGSIHLQSEKLKTIGFIHSSTKTKFIYKYYIKTLFSKDLFLITNY